jgi:hypothetical protein
MPEVIVIDEIGTEAEALAARTIAERGVQLIGTAHGQTLENLMLNPTLCDLIGGIQAVTLSDDEARRRGTQKTVLERKAPPTFDVIIELVDYERLAVHHNVQKTVDLILRGVPPRPEIRVRTGAGKVEVIQAEETHEIDEPGFNRKFPSLARAQKENGEQHDHDAPHDHDPQRGGSVRIFPYGIARTRLERAIRERRAAAAIVNDISQADAVIAIRSTFQARPRKLREMAGRPVPTVVVKSNTYSQLAIALDDALRQVHEGKDSEDQAMEEVLQAIETVSQTGKPFDLSPQPAPIRKVQHQFAETQHYASESVGEEPHRRLRVLPTKLG